MCFTWMNWSHTPAVFIQRNGMEDYWTTGMHHRKIMQHVCAASEVTVSIILVANPKCCLHVTPTKPNLCTGLLIAVAKLSALCYISWT